MIFNHGSLKLIFVLFIGAPDSSKTPFDFTTKLPCT